LFWTQVDATAQRLLGRRPLKHHLAVGGFDTCEIDRDGKPRMSAMGGKPPLAISLMLFNFPFLA
jgi:hypothetical protein